MGKINKNDLVMLGITLAQMQGQAERDAQEFEAAAQAEDFAVHDLEIARHESRGYAAGLAAAFDLIKTKIEQTS